MKARVITRNRTVLRIVGRLFFFVLLLSLPTLAPAEGMDSARTNVIKAGMVNGFTAYTTWPDAQSTEPFVIGVMGQDSNFIFALERFFKKKPIAGGRQLQIKPITLEQVLDCHVVVILGDANKQAKLILSKVAKLPILTISDREHFAQSGGHVNFFSENNKLRFEINWQSTTQSKLKVSSRLLRLARVVGKSE